MLSHLKETLACEDELKKYCKEEELIPLLLAKSEEWERKKKAGRIVARYVARRMLRAVPALPLRSWSLGSEPS